VGSGTGSSPNPELAAALHRLRSTLGRLKAELELALVDGTAAPVERLLEDVRDALGLLSAVEDWAYSNRAVVVVDDDSRLAEITARGLRRLGFDARSERSLGSLRADDVVVFDLSLLAEIDGSSLQSLRASRPIVVTGATDPASRALAVSVDASDYLVKPVELDELAAAINRRMAEASR
jgi:CheY-like chemotaxis protein